VRIAIDDASRVANAQILRDEPGDRAVGFLRECAYARAYHHSGQRIA